MKRVEIPTFHSSFSPSQIAIDLLCRGRIMDKNETPNQMMERVVGTLVMVEDRFGYRPEDSFEFGALFLSDLDNKRVIMSTPILTNAGRYEDKPLSACTIPPVSLRGDIANTRSLIDVFHQDGMGTGFNLNDTSNPVEALNFFNAVAIEGEDSGQQDRPVGNMGILSVHHPQILDFITAKSRQDGNARWIFNISADASDQFMQAVIDNNYYALQDGRKLSARMVFNLITESAHKTGDPGLIFLHRMNKDNPTPGIGEYVGTAPCAEVGLAPGESCIFGYVNVGAFYDNGDINFPLLSEVTGRMVRALDNALELSIDRYPHPQNSSIMRAKRKIGVGICGLSDLLIQMGIPYDSEKAFELSRDIVAFINFESKVASHELAKTRGSFEAMNLSVGNRYSDDPGYLEDRYGNINTEHTSADEWIRLGRHVRESKLLRHASTIALPPTGRSGLIIDASTGIEPLFSLQRNGTLQRHVADMLVKNGVIDNNVYQRILATGSVQGVFPIPTEVQRIVRTALEIVPHDHILMAASLQPVVDEAISKTVNMPEDCTPQEIGDVYLDAYQNGLKGITVYRANSRINQPKELTR